MINAEMENVKALQVRGSIKKIIIKIYKRYLLKSVRISQRISLGAQVQSWRKDCGGMQRKFVQPSQRVWEEKVL